MDQELTELLTNYKGTLSVKDQKIFFELQRYDHVNFNLINENGYVEFGKSRKSNLNGLNSEPNAQRNDELNEKSSHRSNDEPNQKLGEKPDDPKADQANDDANNKKLKKLNLNQQSCLSKFLKQFKQPLIKSSIFSFPSDIELDRPIDYGEECLDPRFLLLSFYQLINQRKTTLDEFIDTNCLAITFVSLSFKDDRLRRVGYAVLVKLKQNLCADSYGIIWRIILDKFAASLKEGNQLIQPLITSFLVHIIPFIKTPTYSIHEQLTKFLCNYSSFKFSSIVGFILSMLIIDDPERHSFYQEVALLVLKNGLKTEDDFSLCLHGKIVDFLLVNYNSSLLVKRNLKIKVLEIFKLITRLPEASKLLCTEKAFLLWLNQLIVEENQIETLNKLNQIISQLSELNCDFYPLFQIELKMVKNVCAKKLDHLFEQDLNG